MQDVEEIVVALHELESWRIEHFVVTCASSIRPIYECLASEHSIQVVDRALDVLWDLLEGAKSSEISQSLYKSLQELNESQEDDSLRKEHYAGLAIGIVYYSAYYMAHGDFKYAEWCSVSAVELCEAIDALQSFGVEGASSKPGDAVVTSDKLADRQLRLQRAAIDIIRRGDRSDPGVKYALRTLSKSVDGVVRASVRKIAFPLVL
jgi:hypothetical protein